MSIFTIRPFKATDFPVYELWFKDEVLRQYLGGVDREWLDFVLNDKTGMEYAVTSNGELVAVIGIVFTDEHWVISNLAVLPNMRGKGIGHSVLQSVISEHPSCKLWVAFVDVNNNYANRFFQKLGWQQSNDGEMLKYTLT